MRPTKIAISIGAAGALALGLVSGAEPQEGANINAPPGAVAELKDAKGDVVGLMGFTDGHHGVVARLTLTAAAPVGSHALHLHEVGRCDAPTFDTAGGHFNPQNHAHGFTSDKGRHAGDLPNVHGAGDKRELEYFVDAVTLREGQFSLLDADGSSVVLHAGMDDHRSDPDGGAGARIACGVVEKK